MILPTGHSGHKIIRGINLNDYNEEQTIFFNMNTNLCENLNKNNIPLKKYINIIVGMYLNITTLINSTRIQFKMYLLVIKKLISLKLS